MAGKFKVSETRATSKRICEEKLFCSGGAVKFWCENCGSRQCSLCESQLHESKPKFLFHDREEIIQSQYPEGTEVCQKWCNPYNAACVKCEECKSVFCEECNKGYHIGKLSKHHRKLIPKLEPPVVEENLLLLSDVDDDIQQIADECSDDFQTGIDFGEPQALSSLPHLEIPAPTDIFSSCANPLPIVHTSKGTPVLGPSQATSNLLDCKTSQNSLKLANEDLGKDMSQNRQAAVVQPNSHLSLTDDSIETALLLTLEPGKTDHFAEPEKKSRPVPRPRAKSACGAEAAPNDQEGESDQAALLTIPQHNSRPGFLLVNGDEKLQVKSEPELLEKLGCEEDVKIVSIFGNTGDGKSHTLNHTFFDGQEVFITSQLQESCTVGVWAAYDDNLKVVTVDTEGLLGVSPNENQRTRLLLKVLAISDIVIYRTRADRLHSDLFRFIGDASLAYQKHFNKELTITADRIGEDISLSTIGPVVLVFQETQHTDVLGFGAAKSADELLRERFEKIKLNIRAFSSIHYVGTRTDKPPTNFGILKAKLKEHIKDNSVRSPRPVSVVFAALKVLNEKFSGEIETTQPKTFPDEYFTCTIRCLACLKRCTKTMNHKDKVGHETDGRCKYLHQHDNRVYICKACLEKGGEEVVVVPKTSSCNDSSWVGLAKYAWSGYVLECPNCGIIFRSRQYWYGNQDPVDAAVRTEIRHVWPGGHMMLQGTTDNTSRKVIDGLSYLIDTVSSVSKKPTSMISDWISDQIAPLYWIPNSQIVECNKCGLKFENDEKKHHCRACGNGFCDECSTQRLPVPEKGWGEAPVRVCDDCFDIRSKQALEVQEEGLEQPPVMARKVGEAFQNTLGMVANVMVYPKDYLLDVARPVYWVPDDDIINCTCCKKEFTPKIRKHHCRACGQGVCSDCSGQTKPVPSRGWDQPVRVCNDCSEKETL